MFLLSVWAALGVAGVKGLYFLLRHFSNPSDSDAGEDIRARAESVVACLDSVIYYSPAKPTCLLRSAALVMLLRSASVPCALVIGVKHMPFGAHAWVEITGTGTIISPEDERSRYQVIERL